MILNREQQQVLSAPNHHTLLLAGAGTGKTTLLIAKINQLLKQSIKPEKILLLTFSRRAANEMMERLETDNTVLPYGGTFHAVFMKLIQEDLGSFGFHQMPLLITEPEQKKIYNSILKDLKLPRSLHKPFLKQLKQVKGNGLTPDMLQIDPNNQHEITFQQSYQHYQLFLKIQQMVDFDDLLLLPLNRMNRDPHYLKNRFQHILIDEYQDINRLQSLLLTHLVTKQNHLLAVGDDDQAIYSFRGANSDQIHHFNHIYSDSVIFTLSTNYRCCGSILKTALRLIGNNNYRYPKALNAFNDQNTPIQLKEHLNSEHEINGIMNQIRKLPESDTMAILCRYRYQLDTIAKRLTQEEIPFQRLDRLQEGGIDLIKLVLMAKLIRYPEQPILKQIVKEQLRQTEYSFKLLIENQTPKMLGKQFQHALSESLYQFLISFQTFDLFLQNYDHYTLPSQDGIKLGTIHSAKGLAFDHLFLPYLAADLFPGKSDHIEEERRLLYVAITRARKQVFLSYPRISVRFGQTLYHEPSPFLKELPEIYLNIQ